MIKRVPMRPIALLMVLLVGPAVLTAGAQDDAASDAADETTLEARIEELERTVASLDTRLMTRTTGRNAELPSQLLEQRVAQLERSFAMLRADLQRIERTADAALRTAADAQRTAANAEREARAAASRF